MHDLSTQLQNASVRFNILAEEHATTAAAVLDEADERIARMLNPADSVVRQVRDSAEAKAEKLNALSAGYSALAESAREGRLYVPANVYRSPDFTREFQTLIGQASQAGRFKITGEAPAEPPAAPGPVPRSGHQPNIGFSYSDGSTG